MSGQRQKAGADLVNQRGGRSRGVARARARLAVPELPDEVANPQAVWLPADLLRAFTRSYRADDVRGMVDEGWARKAAEEKIRLEAQERLAAIGERAQELARAEWRAFFESDAGQVALGRPEYQEELRWWIVRVFQRALFEPVVMAMPLMVGPNGNAVRNPLSMMVAAASADIARASAKFGMTTQDSFRLNFTDPDEGDEDEMEAAMRAKPVAPPEPEKPPARPRRSRGKQAQG